MLEIASLIVVNLIIAAIIGMIIGYIIGKNSFPKIKSIANEKTEENRNERFKHTLNPIFKKNSNLDFKPLVLSTPKPIGKDNLKKIKGINSKIERDLNNIDPVYRHAMGDYDFGCAAKRSGYRILASNFFVGKCNDNPVTNTWKDSSLSRSQRLKMKESPKGLPLREWFYFLNKNHGFITAIVYSISGYVKIVLGK